MRYLWTCSLVFRQQGNLNNNSFYDPPDNLAQKLAREPEKTKTKRRLEDPRKEDTCSHGREIDPDGERRHRRPAPGSLSRLGGCSDYFFTYLGIRIQGGVDLIKIGSQVFSPVKYKIKKSLFAGGGGSWGSFNPV